MKIANVFEEGPMVWAIRDDGSVYRYTIEQWPETLIHNRPKRERAIRERARELALSGAGGRLPLTVRPTLKKRDFFAQLEALDSAQALTA